MFTRAIVRKPGPNFADGITTAGLGKPDYARALEQHARYVEVLKRCGLEVIVLEGDERFPDSTFVEDPAIVTEKCAIITRPGAASRQGEEAAIRDILAEYYAGVECIAEGGTLEGGDVLRVDDHFYIGLSNRTNAEGARQLIAILQRYGYSGSTVRLQEFLHLKTGITYLSDGNFVAAGEFIGHEAFAAGKMITTDEAESYAANCLYLNGYVLMAAGFPRTRAKIEQAGYEVLETDISEFRKMDGGLSCLSLRF